MKPENLSPPVPLQPDEVRDFAEPPELQQARALWVANRLNESLRFYDRAVRLSPENPVALVEAAAAFGNRFEIRRAEELLARLVPMTSDPRFLMAAGKCYQVIGRLNGAIECYESVLAIAPDHFESHLELSQIFERINQLKQAAIHNQRCFAIDANAPASQLVLGQLKRRSGDLVEAEHCLRRLSIDENSPTAIRVSAGYQLGYLFDDSSRFEEAFDSVSTAKTIQLAGSAELLEKSRQELKTQEELWKVSNADIVRWGQETAALPSERIAFLVGAPRSGTTLLERVLGSHREITSTDEEFFLPQMVLPELLNNRDHRTIQLSELNQIPIGRLKIERDRYFRFLTSALGSDSREKLHVDKNPSFIRLLPAILRVFPEAKILFAIRDPRDIVVSCFMRQFPINPISVEFLTLEGAAISVARDLQLWQTLKRQLPNQWLEVKYEDMVADLELTSKSALEFLGAGWDASVLDFHRSTAPVNSPTYEAVAKPIYQSASGRWKNYEVQLQAVMPILKPVIDAWDY